MSDKAGKLHKKRQEIVSKLSRQMFVGVELKENMSGSHFTGFYQAKLFTIFIRQLRLDVVSVVIVVVLDVDIVVKATLKVVVVVVVDCLTA